jgi:hypothetical protein
VDRVLADEFVEFGSSGRAYSERDVVEGVQNEPPVHRTLKNLRARSLEDDVDLQIDTERRRSASALGPHISARTPIQVSER